MRPTVSKIAFSIGIAVFLNACTNALYFYETDKVSLTIEARPDSSQPVQGNFGLKQRVALIAPPKNYGDGDALSSISSFRVNIIEESGFNPLSIRSAFITGDAAKGLSKNQATRAATVIAGSDIGTYTEIADDLVNDLKNEEADLKTLKSLTMKPFDQLTAEDLSNLENITGLTPDIYTQAFHQALRKRLVKEGN